MDPISAVSFAGTVIQLVSLVASIVSKSQALYCAEDGALASNVALQEATDRLTTLIKTLGTTPPRDRGSKSESAALHAKAIKTIGKSCVATAKELSKILEKLKVQDNRKWTSIHQALRSVWKQKKIDSLTQSIGKYRDELVTHLLAMTIEDQAFFQGSIDRKLSEIRSLQTTNKTELSEMKIEILEAFRSPTSKDVSAADVEYLAEKLLAMNLREENDRIEEVILDSLYLPQIRERYDRITKAHSKTFEWIFQGDLATQGIENNFNDWLSKGSGCYWIAGKPGSGKSTLMKFICRDKRTLAGLRTWAGASELITASFYFWIAGVSIQKSSTGLLQSLIYEMIQENRRLIPKLFPWRWRTHQYRNIRSQPWTENEFWDAIKILKTQTAQDAKFCFFIDGLDEFEGDHDWLVKFARELGDLPHVKLCVSSRPWTVFEDAFTDVPMLRVQDLTQGDIKQYAKVELESHQRWSKLCKQEPNKAPELIHDISSKSSGVFLWVYLVIKSLKNGLRNGDSISDLQRRVDSFPSDLEDYFMHILGRLEPFYFHQAKKFFRVAIESDAPLLLTTYSFLDENDPEFGQKAPLKPFTPEEIAFRCEETKRRLNSRCKDLLEVYVENGSDRAFALSNSSYKNWAHGLPSDAFNAEYITKVGFLHRTVRDFLETPGAKIKLVATEEDNFDASHWLLQASLAQIKGLSHGSIQITKKDAFKQLIRPAISTLQKLGLSRIAPSNEFLDDLDRASISSWAKEKHWTSLYIKGFNHVLSLAVFFGFAKYTDVKLHSPEFFYDKELKAKLLGLALAPHLFGGDLDPSMQKVQVTASVRVLLDAGADPNQLFHFSKGGLTQMVTAWDLFNKSCSTGHRDDKTDAEIHKLLSQARPGESLPTYEQESGCGDQSPEHDGQSRTGSDSQVFELSSRNGSSSPEYRAPYTPVEDVILQPRLKRSSDPFHGTKGSMQNKRLRRAASVVCKS
ncbi:hypothetical protein MMC11_000920 [Xylographa trunciseda]|nr:hypothetical protein [Xylographa trunciseda]